MSIKMGIITGSVAGSGVAIILITLDNIGPFSPNMNAFVDRLTFRLCPLYMLGFTNLVTSNSGVVVLAILGNAVLGAALFGGLTAILSLFKRVV